MKVAVTDGAALIVTVQAPVPVQAPLQPRERRARRRCGGQCDHGAVGVRAGTSAPHEMPAGALVTVPLPVPVLVTVSAKSGGMKVAVTDVAALIVTVQAPVPVQAPLQPVNVEPAAGARSV